MTEVLSVSPAERGPTLSVLRRTSSGFLHTDIAKSYIHSSPRTHSYSHADYGRRSSNSVPSSGPPSPQLSQTTFSCRPSLLSTPASSISLDTKLEVDYEEDILFPSYDGASQTQNDEEIAESPVVAPPTSSPEADDIPILRPRTGSEDLPISAGDDHAIEKEPTRHVDYLSHEWREEDIWSSWRYIVSRRSAFPNSVRLENASWRTWAKTKHNLKTVSAEKLNWLKDCDVTWLYGPLQTCTKRSLLSKLSPPVPYQLHPSSSFLNKKPILKKRSTSEAILQRSISSHSLLKHAGAILKAQQASPSKARPSFQRAISDFSHPVFSKSSTHNTPAVEDGGSFPSGKPSLSSSASSSGLTSPGERRHIHFNNEVVQCIAVEGRGGDYDDEQPEVYDEDDDEGVVMMKPSRPKLSNQSTPRGSFSSESKTIAPLPSTTLRGDTPEPSEAGTPKVSGVWPQRPILSPSPSQETIRPTRPSTNFLLDDDDEAGDLSWNPPNRGYSLSTELTDHGSDEEEYEPGPGMHRTSSGMFMPYEDEDEDEAAMNSTVFRKVADTVNTAKDIAHVIWNVGWRR